jgi:hypothetical protein
MFVLLTNLELFGWWICVDLMEMRLWSIKRQRHCSRIIAASLLAWWVVHFLGLSSSSMLGVWFLLEMGLQHVLLNVWF